LRKTRNIINTISNKLRDLGLEECEAKLYLILTLQGNLSIITLAKSSNIPKNIMNDSLKRLIQKNLIRKIPGKHKRYSVIPIKNVIAYIQSTISNAIKEFKRFKKI
jgi:sugar-specific transcriptional regulator TrmB